MENGSRKPCPMVRCAPFDQITPKPKRGEIRRTMIPHASANLYQRELKPSLHWTSAFCKTRDMDGGQLRRLLGHSLCLRLRLRLRLRLLGRLHWMILRSPRRRLRLRHLEIGRVRKLHLHLRLLLDHPLLLLRRQVGHLRRSRLVLLRRHRSCFRRSPLHLKVCLSQGTRCAEKGGLRSHGQSVKILSVVVRINSGQGEITKKSVQSSPSMPKVLLTKFRSM